jgi:hypothetical protein
MLCACDIPVYWTQANSLTVTLCLILMYRKFGKTLTARTAGKVVKILTLIYSI